METPAFRLRTACLLLLLGTMTCVHAAQPEVPKPKPNKELIERGRYLAIVSGCSDCHTAGYVDSEGRVPEREWLLGSSTGFRGIWGTTYATNLRLSLSKMPEDQWVTYAKALETRPPMPWFNLQQWSEEDLRAFYHFVRQLGPVGRRTPNPVPPHEEPRTAVIRWPWPEMNSSTGNSRPPRTPKAAGG